MARSTRQRDKKKSSRASSRSRTNQTRPARPPARRTPREPFRVPALDAPELDRLDLWLTLAIAAGASLLFLSTFSSRVAPGDAPESVAGVKDLGILHAPGYPSYVLVARAFTAIVPFGSLTVRVQLFSVVCSVIAVSGLYVLARIFRTTRSGAAIGATSIATAASFWYNSSFAKHYAFSAATVVVAAVLGMQWRSKGRSWMLVGAAAALGFAFGSAWQLALFMAVAIALSTVGGTRPSRALALTSLAVMGALAVGWYAWVMVRAGQNPRLDFGGADSIGAVLRLVSQRDFSHQYSVTDVSNPFARYALRLVSYPLMVLRDVGFGAGALILAGAFVAWVKMDRGAQLFLASLLVLDFVGVIYVVPIDHVQGFRSGMFAGGYFLDLMVAVAVLIAVGCTLVSRVAPPLMGGEPGSVTTRRRSAFAVGAVLVLLVVVPSVVFHYTPANHRIPNIVDDYTIRVLRSLPPNTLLVVYEADMEFPYDYEQIVRDERPDVSLIALDNFGFGWYVDQIAERLDVPRPAEKDPLKRGIEVVDEERARRPVYLDTGAMQVLHDYVGYRLRGLVAEVTSGVGPQTVPDLASLATQIHDIDQADGMVGHKYDRFVNQRMLLLRARVHVELAKAYVLVNDPAGAASELERALDIYPDDGVTRDVLHYLNQSGASAYKLLLDI